MDTRHKCKVFLVWSFSRTSYTMRGKVPTLKPQTQRSDFQNYSSFRVLWKRKAKNWNGDFAIRSQVKHRSLLPTMKCSSCKLHEARQWLGGQGCIPQLSAARDGRWTIRDRLSTSSRNAHKRERTPAQHRTPSTAKNFIIQKSCRKQTLFMQVWDAPTSNSPLTLPFSFVLKSVLWCDLWQWEYGYQDTVVYSSQLLPLWFISGDC